MVRKGAVRSEDCDSLGPLDAGHDWSKADNVGEIEYVVGDTSSVVKLKKLVARLMITSTEDSGTVRPSGRCNINGNHPPTFLYLAGTEMYDASNELRIA